MSTEETRLKVCPKLVKSDKALKLVESWVNNMSRSTTDESTEVDFVGRPPRLGLGAKAIHQQKAGDSTNPVERKLRAKLDSEKRKASKSIEESNPSERSDGDDDDEDSESRTNAFVKKRERFLALSLQTKKKRK